MQQPVVKSGRVKAGASVTVTPAGAEPSDRPAADGAVGLVEQHAGPTSGNQAQTLIGQSRERAQGVLSAAEAEASRILEKARAEAAALLEQADALAKQERSDAASALKAELEQQYASRYAQACQALAGAAKQLNAAREDYLTGLNGAALELVLGLARKLILGEWEASAEPLGRLVASALGVGQQREVATLELSPATLQRVTEIGGLEDFLEREGIRRGLIELKFDRALGDGQFRLNLANAVSDFNLESVLCEAESLIRNAVLHPEAALLECADDAGGESP